MGEEGLKIVQNSVALLGHAYYSLNYIQVQILQRNYSFGECAKLGYVER